MVERPPRKPRLALTLAVAGKRAIPDDLRAGAEDGLNLVFRSIGERLDALHAEAVRGDNPLAHGFATADRARLTLVTGLADGADQIAADLFVKQDADAPELERALGAILPCAREPFVTYSKVADSEAFEHLIAACDFVIELDAPMPSAPEAGDDASVAERARQDRAEAFQGQSEFLLRQADVLVAVDSPGDLGRDGGTRQTIRNALDFGMPVILIQLGRPGIAVLRARADLDEPIPLPEHAAYKTLAGLVDSAIGVADDEADGGYFNALLAEFFAETEPAPRLRAWLWNRFEERFAKGASVPPTPELEPYADYRHRARALSAFYAGEYRGSFLLTYALAVVAVALALLSQAVLLTAPPGEGPASPFWWALLALGAGKLGVLVGIARLVGAANHHKYAHRAADYRYLSERLRTMMFLPHAGSLRPPSPWSLPYTTRVATQGLMDRVFVSILRQVQPQAVLANTAPGVAIQQDARAAHAMIRDAWLASQAHYHRRNHKTLAAMSHWLERVGRWLNRAVIGVVVLDIAILLSSGLNLLPSEQAEPLHAYVAPTLIFLAAIFPAAVASLNGVRFQSESARLADRSAHMALQLGLLHNRANMPRPRAVRMLDALRLAEDVARLTLDEVAEWSAIYGKEFVEM